MSDTIKNFFNAHAGKEPADKKNAVVQMFMQQIETGDHDGVTALSRALCPHFEEDDQAEIVYQLVKNTKDEQWDIFYKNSYASIVSLKSTVVTLAFEDKNIDALKRITPNDQQSSIPKYLSKIDVEWFKENYTEIEAVLDIKVQTPAFQDTLYYFIKEDRLDVLKVFLPQIPSFKRRYENLFYNALKERNQEAIEYFLTDATFKNLAKQDHKVRYNCTKSIFKEAQEFEESESLCMRIFEKMHTHGVFKGLANHIDFDKIIRKNQIDFVGLYLNCGYKIHPISAASYVGICAARNYTDMMRLILSTQDHASFNNDFNMDYFKTAVLRDHLECVKMLHDAGLTKRYSIGFENARSIEMLEYLRTQGYDFPADKKRMMTGGRSYKYKAYIDRQYRYKDIRENLLTLAKEDKEYLGNLSLARLRKPQTLPSGIKGRGITLAAMGGMFEHVKLAAARHQHPMPLRAQDLIIEDPQLKRRPIEVLIATDTVTALFEPLVWQNDIKNFEIFWQAAIPEELKDKYQNLYQSCHSALKVAKMPSTSGKATPLKRRRPKMG